jgi:prevent-host-death family protein
MPKLTTLPKTASVQDIQRNYRKLVDEVKATGDPLFVLRNNTPEAVIIDVDSWNSITKRSRAEEEREALEAVRIYKKEKKAGKLKILKGSLTDLMN